MKNVFLTALLLAMFFRFGMTQTFPYDIQLEAFTIPGLNGVHSYAGAESAGKWLIISGRTDGMHRGGGGQNNPPFPASNNNTTIYVVDPVAEQAWSTSLSSLPISIQDQMCSTNTNFYQDGNTLYIIGGYGENSSGNHVTYDYITAIDVPSIIDNIINGNSITNDFIQLQDNRMKIAGGQLGKIGSTFYLVGGMELTGLYSMNVNPIYSSEIRNFEIVNNGSSLTINNYSTQPDAEFHRRDYNLVPQIFPNGDFGYMVSSGVFTPSDGVYYNPIEIDANGYTVIPTATFKQEFSHYQSAKLALYSTTDNEMHSIFFGGIAQYYYDSNGNKIDDPDVPFVKTISRVTRDANGVYSESVFSTEMPVYLGAGSELFLDENLPSLGHGILDMDNLPASPITVGYIFGGLQSNAADIFPSNTSNSSASNTIYRVKLVSAAPLPIELVRFQGEAPPTANCSKATVKLIWETASEINASYFEVERGKYGNFERIGSVVATGGPATTQHYSFVDENPIQGAAYYRLKMIDRDGSFKYSDILHIESCKTGELEIAPNPTSGRLFIRGNLDKVKMELMDADGRRYDFQTRNVNGGLQLDMSGFPSGIYFIKTSRGESYKVIKE